MMTLACITLVIPAAYNSVKSPSGSLFADPLNTTTAIGAAGSTSLSLNSSQPGIDPERINGLLTISRGTAVLLLGVYVAYLYFQVVLKSATQVYCLRSSTAAQVPCVSFPSRDGKRRGGSAQDEHCCCIHLVRLDLLCSLLYLIVLEQTSYRNSHNCLLRRLL